MGNCFSSAGKFFAYILSVLCYTCIDGGVVVYYFGCLVNMSAGFRIGNYCFSAGRVISFSQVCHRLMPVEGQTYMCVGNGTETH